MGFVFQGTRNSYPRTVTIPIIQHFVHTFEHSIGTIKRLFGKLFLRASRETKEKHYYTGSCEMQLRVLLCNFTVFINYGPSS